MLSKKSTPVKLIFPSLRNHKEKKLKPLFWLSAFVLFTSLTALQGTAAAGNWELIPENPAVGDVIEIRGSNFTGETAEVLVVFEEEVQTSDGRYEYMLEGVEILPGFNNRFSVQAKDVNDLNVRVKMILWVTRTAKAKEGVASISQPGVPPGTYRIKIDGKSDASLVKLKITGLQQVKVDSGSFSYKYNTGSMPAGSFEIRVGNAAKQVTLSPAENPSSDAVLSSDREKKPEEGFSSGWKAWAVLTGGALAGAILLLLYSRTKKS